MQTKKANFLKFLDDRGYKHEGLTVTHQGSVNLRSLTSLPEGIKFENQGSVYLRSLTSLPEGIKFENQGYVYLRSLTCTWVYRGVAREFATIDDSTMIVTGKTKASEEIEILKCRYFGGGKVEDLRKCYVARSDEHAAHGETVKEAMEDLRFKVLQADGDVSEVVEEIKTTGKVSVMQYRLITGACKLGVKNFMEENGIEGESLSVARALELTKGAYGGGRFAELVAAG